METILEYIRSINWNGPQAFGVAAVFLFIIMRKWASLVLVLVTFGVASKIENYFIVNFEVNGVPVTSSMLVYVIGTVAIVFVTFLSVFDK